MMESTTFQVERLLSAEQKATDYRSPDDGIAPDHRPTNACTRWIQLKNLELVNLINKADIFLDSENWMGTIFVFVFLEHCNMCIFSLLIFFAILKYSYFKIFIDNLAFSFSVFVFVNWWWFQPQVVALVVPKASWDPWSLGFETPS